MSLTPHVRHVYALTTARFAGLAGTTARPLGGNGCAMMRGSSWLALPLLLLLACSARVAADCEQLAGATFCDRLPERSASFRLGWNLTSYSGRERAFACQLRIHQKELGLTDLQTAYVIGSVWRESRFNLVSEAGCEDNRCRCPPECTPSTICQACLDSNSTCAGCAPLAARNCTCLAQGCPSPLAAWYSPYYGRGYLKLLWKDNYASMAGLFSNCPLEATPEILLQNHAVALKVAVQIMINAKLKNYLPASITNPTDEQLVKARRMVNAADVKDCSASGLPADCPVSNCGSLANTKQRRACAIIAGINSKARAWLALLRNPEYRVGYCGDSVPPGGNAAKFAPLVRLSQFPQLLVSYRWTAANKDLDTSTGWLGTSVGWSCSLSNYMRWGGDNRSYGGQETATVDLAAAFRDGQWNASANTEITAHAGWYTLSNGTGPFTLVVELLDANGVARPIEGGELSLIPGNQMSCVFEYPRLATITLVLQECGNVPDSAYYSVSLARAEASEAASAAFAVARASAEVPPPKPGWDEPPPEGAVVAGAP
ncbi:hypothetical protein Rsub_10056 [Raphidocelis subcapitata]|uniref:Uncharacterized protein n=1 Tax=Raphidocelis subcapitata TaxID=307507 RepID=A0A2V0PJH2_9CHLO|nr:hypothetical protein Rsub_10056 [Raphidocelis subcapitata]|eukprot:GBF97195.1 hypothetical protein Rsub_10056 [Raphidocelis subcapitata]